LESVFLVDEDVKNAIKTAIQMEKDGYAFYKKASAQTSSDMGREIFNSLAKDEQLHLEIFQKLFEDRIKKSEWDTLVNSSKKYTDIDIFPKDLQQIEGANPNTNELDAIKIAMDSEKDAIEYYGKINDKTKEDDIKQIINEIIEQEKNHYSILQEEFEHLTKTGYWYELDFLGG
jgi:rubrerythrin